MTTPAGWYPDHADPTRQRYWDGTAWNDETVEAEPGQPYLAPAAEVAVVQPVMAPQISNDPRRGRQFAFDGGAGTYFGTGLLALLITVFTLGICYPFALVLRERWRCKHSFINGQQLAFTGLAIGLFGLWIKWFLLSIITVGIYLFWVGPRIQRWKWEHTSFVGHVVAAPVQA